MAQISGMPSPVDSGRPAAVDVILAVGAVFGLLLLALFVNFIDEVAALFPGPYQLYASAVIANILVFWLFLFLWLAFSRWREAARARGQLQALVGSISPDTLLVVAPDRTIRMVNSSVERMFGLTPAEAISRKTDLLYFDRRVNPDKPHEIYEALERDGFHVGVAKGKRRDGSTFPLEIIAAEMGGDGGAVLLLRDITERVRAEEARRKMESRMQQRDKMESLGILASGIAHDFNNLLAGILGNADLAINDLLPDSPLQENISAIVKTARRAAELCKEMLAYSGKGRFQLEVFDLSDVARETGDLLEVTVPDNVELEYKLATSLPGVEGDGAQVRQVVMNLIRNAADALTDQDGTVTIETGVRDCDTACLADTALDEPPPPGRFVFVAVTDTGCGMDAETIKKIFDPFFSTKTTGRGLGLASAQGIIRGHRGALKVVSQPGVGTTFTILFPASDKLPQRPESTGGLDAWRGEGLALVIDDEETVLDFAERMLRHLGFDVMTASGGKEGIDVFREHADAVRFVLLDMTMPVVSGDQVFGELVKIRPDVPVVLTSGYNREDAHSRFPNGARPAAFIQKPYQIRALMATVKDLLAD